MSKTVKYCYVPTCNNNSKVQPAVRFFSVPEKDKLDWFLAVGIKQAPKRRINICEEHLDLEEDIDNYSEWKRGFARKVTLKRRIPKQLCKFKIIKFKKLSIESLDEITKKEIEENTGLNKTDLCWEVPIIKQEIEDDLIDKHLPSSSYQKEPNSNAEPDCVNEFDNSFIKEELEISSLD